MNRKGKVVVSFLDDILVELSPAIVYLVKQLPSSLKKYFKEIDENITDKDCLNRDEISIVNWLCKDPTDLELLTKCYFIITELIDRNDIYQKLKLTKFATGLLSTKDFSKKYFPIEKFYILYEDIPDAKLLKSSRENFIKWLSETIEIDIKNYPITNENRKDIFKKIGFFDVFIGNMDSISFLVADPDINIYNKEFLFPNTQYNKKLLIDEIKVTIAMVNSSISSFEI